MDNRKAFIPALLAVGGSIASLPASAIELGDISVQSALGQPLRASIAYALAPNERLSNYCVTLAPGYADSGVPAVNNATVSVAGGVISLTGHAVVREPLMSVRVKVACPYTPNMSREYMLFIDPALPVRSETPASSESAAAIRPQTVQGATARSNSSANKRPTARRSAENTAPIDAISRYRVQPGDTLSDIAARIENRPVGLWNAVSSIFDANPHAFINSDPNKLKAGSWLDIPDFGGNATVVSNEPVFAPEPAAVVSAAAVTPAAAVDVTNILEPAASPAVPDLQPGELALDRNNPSVETAEPSTEAAQTGVGIVDTSIEVTTSAESPNVPTASITTATTARLDPESKTNWLIWMIGGGIALLCGLLLFGRRNRYDDSDPYAEAEAAHPMRRSSDTATVETLAQPEYDLDDDSPTAENLALDADLEMGTGLQGSTDMEVHQDFGFAATTDLDFEFPDDDSTSTDMMSIPTVEELTVLESEVLPGEDDYDMSVIVDATKMPRPDDATMHDLKAVAVEYEDDSDDEDKEYTLDQEIDYQILEQDYEDELTATQALNMEIEKAAAELTGRFAATNASAASSDDETAEMRLATVTEIDSTSRMPSDETDDRDVDDSGVSAELNADLSAEDKTVEMPKSDNDDTAEMTVESGKVDTKAG